VSLTPAVAMASIAAPRAIPPDREEQGERTQDPVTGKQEIARGWYRVSDPEEPGGYDEPRGPEPDQPPRPPGRQAEFSHVLMAGPYELGTVSPAGVYQSE